MKRVITFALIIFAVTLTAVACKKNQPSTKIEGTYTGHFQGTVDLNDTIINTGYKVIVTRTDKNKATVTGSLFNQFEVLVTPNGLNVELVSPTEGLSQFLYEGETKTLTFTYTHEGDVAIYNGTK